jgi:hypothetical protein
MKVISKEDFAAFVESMINDDSLNTIGVKTKGDKYVFDVLESHGELKLDYDVTLLPPKSTSSQRESLFTYNINSGLSSKNEADSKTTVILDVHPYDIVALLHMDEIFRRRNLINTTSKNGIRP